MARAATTKRRVTPRTATRRARRTGPSRRGSARGGAAARARGGGPDGGRGGRGRRGGVRRAAGPRRGPRGDQSLLPEDEDDAAGLSADLSADFFSFVSVLESPLVDAAGCLGPLLLVRAVGW